MKPEFFFSHRHYFHILFETGHLHPTLSDYIYITENKESYYSVGPL